MVPGDGVIRAPSIINPIELGGRSHGEHEGGMVTSRSLTVVTPASFYGVVAGGFCVSVPFQPGVMRRSEGIMQFLAGGGLPNLKPGHVHGIALVMETSLHQSYVDDHRILYPQEGEHRWFKRPRGANNRRWTRFEKGKDVVSGLMGIPAQESSRPNVEDDSRVRTGLL
ncbi:hypothetical protein NE237_020424 [Protea cynaroides]|uniref:Uncharacterized protein n=1 Tax=Protea cynaroides TaxID=273540 RepID=A0A9Q0K1M7_9MAGN|nr:hypothetical protein NE237_020424 [Protea cynaroides]